MDKDATVKEISMDALLSKFHLGFSIKWMHNITPKGAGNSLSRVPAQ